jgi:tetratricopeptide (TPR) repeat protein
MKTMRLTDLGVGKIEAAHMGISKVVLSLYDNEIESTLQAIMDRARTPVDWEDVSDAEKQAIQKFVIQKYGGKYLGITAAIEGRNEQPDPNEKWKYQTGAAMGELGGMLINWYKLPNNASYQKRVSEALAGLSKYSSDAPQGTPVNFLDNLRKLSALGAKTLFNETERDQIAAQVKQTLLASMGFADSSGKIMPVPTPSPKPPPPALPTPTPVATPKPTPAPSNGLPGWAEKIKLSNTYLDKGIELVEKGDHANAVLEFDKAITENPLNGLAYFYRSTSFEKLSRQDDAARDYQMMIDLKYEVRKALYNRGSLYLNQKKYELAIRDLTRSIGIEPSHRNSHYNRGLAYYNLSDWQKAADDFTAVIQIAPNESGAYVMRARCYCAQNLPVSAIRDQQKAKELGDTVELGCAK